MPTVVSLDAKTIAFDLTYLHTLKAKIRSLNCFDVGFRFETILKSLVLNFLRSSDCINISSPIDICLKPLLIK